MPRAAGGLGAPERLDLGQGPAAGGGVCGAGGSAGQLRGAVKGGEGMVKGWRCGG